MHELKPLQTALRILALGLLVFCLSVGGIGLAAHIDCRCFYGRHADYVHAWFFGEFKQSRYVTHP